MTAPAPLQLFLFPWELASMPDYSRSMPSGVTLGKFWRRGRYAEAPPTSVHRHELVGWTVGCYAWLEPDPSPRAREGDALVRVLWFDVVLRQGPEPPGYSAPDWSNQAQYDGRGLM